MLPPEEGVVLMVVIISSLIKDFVEVISSVVLWAFSAIIIEIPIKQVEIQHPIKQVKNNVRRPIFGCCTFKN